MADRKPIVLSSGFAVEIPSGDTIPQSMVNGLSASLSAKEATANKDATGGYAGLTLFKINFKNAANTFTNFFTNATTAARTYTFQDRDGTIADNTDLALKANLVSPSFTTPTLGVATATSVNKVAITAPATSATITIADGKTVTFNNTIAFSGTDSTTMTFPATSATIARTDAAQTFTSTVTVNGVLSGAGVTSTGNVGFNNATLTVNVQNPIWYFGNASPYGFSYFHGSSGVGGQDAICFHFGTATSAASSLQLLANGFVNVSAGNLAITTVGKGLQVKEGTNAKMGTATLVLGTKTVSTTAVTSSSRIFLSVASLGTVAVATPVAVTTTTAGTSFVITSASATDTSVINWMIIEPA